MRPVRPALLVTLAAVALTGCGGDGDEGDGEPAATGTQPATTATAPPTTATAPAGGVDTNLDRKPVVRRGTGAPPTELRTQDIVEGSGPPAKAGDRVTVHYVGVDYRTGEQFDASWDRNEPFELELGAGMVIPGWDRGLVGMREGGRRRLVIPPDLAYGPQGAPPAIGPNATLIFVVDMVDIA